MASRNFLTENVTFVPSHSAGTNQIVPKTPLQEASAANTSDEPLSLVVKLGMLQGGGGEM